MFYAIVGVIVFIGIGIFYVSKNINKELMQVNSAIKELLLKVDKYLSLNNKEENDDDETIQIKNTNIKQYTEELPKKDLYMLKMQGYFSQFHYITLDSLNWKIDRLESKNIHDKVKKEFYMLFMNALQKNNIKLIDLMIKKEHSPFPTLYRIDFKILDYHYIDFDRYTAVANIELPMIDGSKKIIEIDSFGVRYDVDYFEIDKKYYKKTDIHFFEALKLTYNDFEYESIFPYDKPYWNEDNTLTFSINELQDIYSVILLRQNVLLNTLFEKDLLDFNCSIHDKSWSITNSKFYILDDITEQRKEFIEKYENPDINNLDRRFISAINIYYELINNISYNKPDGYYQMEAIKLLTELAENKHAYSCLIMGVIYYDGLYVLKNINKSKEYLTKAFEYGFKTQSIKVWNDFKFN